MTVPEPLAGAVLLLLGLGMLRYCWQRRPAAGRYLTAAGWLAILAGVLAFTRTWNAVLGTVYALLALSVLAYAVLAAGLQRRTPARPALAGNRALEPEERRTDWLRGTAKAFLAIVLSGIAALGLGLAFAIGMPFETHDRIVIGGLLVPILWGGGMAWTLSDAKLLRATAVLIGASAFGYAVAFLPKALG